MSDERSPTRSELIKKPFKAARLTVDGSMPYEDIEILTVAQERKLCIPNFFEEEQLSFRCKDGLFVIPHWRVTMIHLNKSTKIPRDSVRTLRISLSGELVYEHAWIIDPKSYNAAGIPTIYTEDKQFTFISHEGTFITSDWNICQVEFGHKKIYKK
jgi:hypothetical protein